MNDVSGNLHKFSHSSPCFCWCCCSCLCRHNFMLNWYKFNLFAFLIHETSRNAFEMKLYRGKRRGRGWHARAKWHPQNCIRVGRARWKLNEWKGIMPFWIDMFSYHFSFKIFREESRENDGWSRALFYLLTLRHSEVFAQKLNILVSHPPQR